ncbi:hypothetical protein CP556_07465 [Natrinema sp. CBA1119]|uniref:hypothetical protein n=1 Tax=Natrinema sp. CBA1119 TaxID=1608465 RepID=UPI000BFA4995|nr:hypothetical protein [Natrinema sp. CBA1119]PGF15971.1 hypothetical protein CP556_07465 [Natrinema sp. CBA1119]
MSTDSTAREVFEEIDPDPDAILEAHDAETPAELVEGGGKHETRSDDVVDTTATELFADLEAVETADANSRDTDLGETDRTDEDDDASATRADLEFEFIGDSDVVVRDDGAVVDATAAELDALTATDPTSARATGSDESVETTESANAGSADTAVASSGTLTIRDGRADDLQLVGPDPTPTRLTDDAFDSAAIGDQ